MNEDKDNLIRAFNKFCDDNGYNPLRSECTDFWLNKIQESNKALLTKLRIQLELGRRKLNPRSSDDEFARDISFNDGIDQDIALIDKYLEHI